MINPNAGKRDYLLTGIWRVVVKYGVVLHEWLEGTTVPLFKGKVS